MKDIRSIWRRIGVWAMTIKKQVKQAYEGFVIKVGLSQGRDEVPHKRRVGIVRQRDISVDSSSKKDVVLPSPVESFRKSWEEAMSGQVKPISQLWDALDD